VWALLHIHCGSLEQTGSLTYLFALLEKTQLGGEHPDYHTLLATLLQILDGLILNAWRNECGKTNLADFAKSEPSPDNLLKLAGKILQKYAVPLAKTKIDEEVLESEQSGSNTDSQPTVAQQASTSGRQGVKPVKSKHKSALPSVTSVGPDPEKDKVHQNIRLLTRDLLYVAELVDAISAGDIGRVENFLPQLAMVFCGAGSNNYCNEILHFILNLKHVWTADFAYVQPLKLIFGID